MLMVINFPLHQESAGCTYAIYAHYVLRLTVYSFLNYYIFFLNVFQLLFILRFYNKRFYYAICSRRYI